MIDDEKALELAKVFNPPMIVFSNNITKSLRDTLHNLGKTILLFEGGKSKELDATMLLMRELTELKMYPNSFRFNWKAEINSKR